MRSLLFLFLLSLTLASQGAIYKWVDSRGDVHYSDTPTRDAEEIKLSNPTIYKPTGAAASASGNTSKAPDSRPSERADYRSFVIIAPGNNEVVQAHGGMVSIRFELQPGLKPGHYIQPVVDGRILDQRPIGSVLTIENMARGSHMVHASIHDGSGRLLLRSNIVQFFVQRTSVIEDGKSPPPPDSGASGQSGVDAPQYQPSARPNYSGQPPATSTFRAKSDDSTPGKTNPNYQPTGKPVSSTPGQSNPAFKPNY